MAHKNVMKQETFQIETFNTTHKPVVRQSRFNVEPNKCFLQIGRNKMDVTNLSSFGIATLVSSTVAGEMKKMMSQNEILNGTLSYCGSQVQNVTIKIARIVQIPESVIGDETVAFELTNGSVATETIKALEIADQMINVTKERYQKSSQIPDDYKLLVYELKDFLMGLKEQIDLIEHKVPHDSTEANTEFRQTVAETVACFLANVISTQYKKVQNILVAKDSYTIKLCSDFIRNQIGHLIYDAPFANRAYNKPLGYAGDYEMMNHLYRNELVGASLFTQCMHKYLIDEPAGQAVKNRGYYLLEKIKETVKASNQEVIRILAVASGPAMEQQMFLKEFKTFSDKKIEFVCIDQDEESLKHAQREILSSERFLKTGYKFRFVNLAIKNILANGLPEQNFDLIYTAGLFDYFSDPVANMAAKKLFEGLNENGSLIIGNFSKENPNQLFMEMVLDWHLIYRSHEDMKRLFNNIGKSLDIEHEELGINLFAVLKK